MRITARVPLPPGTMFAPGATVRINPAQLPVVRDPSLSHPVGRVVAVTIDGQDLVLDLDLDEPRVSARLAEQRPVF